MSKVLRERGFGSLPSSTETNPRDHVKSVSTTIEADMTPICRIRSSQYTVSAQQKNKLMSKSRRRTIPFLSRLNDYHYDEKKGSNGLQCLDAYCHTPSAAETQKCDIMIHIAQDTRSYHPKFTKN
ncbi:hypothetical protein Tco_1513846 [Tanacetum coccineum]